MVLIVHNSGNKKETLYLNFKSPFGKCFLQKSWNGEMITLKGSTIIQHIDIPANEHVLIISSDTFNSVYDTYEKIFLGQDR